MVCSSREVGGLGIPNLKLLNLALQARWGWLSRTDPTRPWAEFNIQISQLAANLCFCDSIIVGRGSRVKFWTDPWLSGLVLCEVAPNLFRSLPACAKKISVEQGLFEMGWTERIDPDLYHLSITEFLLIWDMVDGVQLSDVDDQFRWRWEGCGHYTASSSYAAFFGAREERGQLRFGTLGARAIVRCSCGWP